MKLLFTLNFIFYSIIQCFSQEKVYKEGFSLQPQIVQGLNVPEIRTIDNHPANAKIYGNFNPNSRAYFYVYTVDQINNKIEELEAKRKILSDSIQNQFRILDSFIIKVDTSIRNELINSINNLNSRILSEEVTRQIEKRISTLIDDKLANLRKEILDLMDSKQ